MNKPMEIPASSSQSLFAAPDVAALRADLALALRAAAHHGLGEGVCNRSTIT